MSHTGTPSNPEDGIQAFRACASDPRLSYTMLLPARTANRAAMPLTVMVHGSLRTPELYRDAMADYAQRTGSAILAPLFPCGLTDADDTESYKFVIRDGIRFDLALRDMVADARRRHPDRVSGDRILMHGFSGGGQFAHRFAYMHPGDVTALSIGAPGKVTLLDKDLPWWRGTGDLGDICGQAVDSEALSRLRVQMVIGADDTDQRDVATEPGSPHWMDGINDAGRDRMTLIHALRDNWTAAGIQCRLDIVEGVAHDGFAVLGAVEDFFESLLAERLAA